jgi:molecular chaperone DnaK (HSP70)
MSVVGFDIGNQTSYIAVARQGGIETVTNDYSQRATPSCVAFGPKNRTMGVAAVQQVATNIKNTIFSFKHLIGRRFDDPIVQEEIKWLPYELLDLPEHRIGIKVTHLGETRVFSPEQILAILLTKLKDVTESYLKTKISDCVLTVPCYWTDTQRRSVLDASKIVELNCLRLVNETTAVALNYGIYKQDLPEESEKARRVLFLDMGHAHTQVSVCAFNKGKLKMLGTAWDLTLGGRDFDAVLRNHFNDEFKQKYKLDAKTNLRAWFRLLDESEKVKKQMSANMNNIPLNIECFMNDKDVSAMMKRSEFESLSTPLWTKLQSLLVRILSEIKLKPGDIDVVELVGGSSRMPMVRQIVQQIFEKEPFTTLNQDEAVSRGSALQCAMLSPAFRVREFNIADVQPFAIKLTWKSDTGFDEGETEVFSEHHQFPFSKMLTFYRKEPFVLEASYAYPNHIPFLVTRIGQFMINNVSPGSDGDSSKVKVKVRINGNGLFTVSSASLYEKQQQTDDELIDQSEEKNGTDDKEDRPQNGPADGTEAMQTDKQDEQQEKASESAGDKVETVEKPKKQKSKVKSVDLPISEIVPGMTEEDIKKFRLMEQELQKQDRQEREKADAKNALEEYVYDMRSKLGDNLLPYINEHDASKFNSMLEDIGNWLYDEGDDQPKQVYNEKLTELKKIGDPVVERYNEAQERPLAIEEFGRTLQMTRKFYDQYLAKDPKYDHIEVADMERVRKVIEEKQSWFEQQMNSQQRRPPTEPPTVFASQIRLEKEALERVVFPVMNKPKPKVELPPEPAAPKGEKDVAAENNQTQKGKQKDNMEVD